jgi:hypothetical protein
MYISPVLPGEGGWGMGIIKEKYICVNLNVSTEFIDPPQYEIPF